jgi:hypothetical protein
VIKALGCAAEALREKLGESLASIQKFDRPPEDVTTASLEALQDYRVSEDPRSSGHRCERCNRTAGASRSSAVPNTTSDAV